MSKREKQTSPQPEVPAPARLRQRTAAVPALQCGKVAPHSQLLLPCREPKQEPSQLFGMLCGCAVGGGLGEGERAPGFLQSLYCRQQLTYIRRKQEQKVPVSTGCWAVAIRAAVATGPPPGCSLPDIQDYNLLALPVQPCSPFFFF